MPTRKTKRSTSAKAHAPALRRDMTDAEAKLWRRLRRRQIAGAYFRRQSPIGPYIADFVCNDAKLVIELDGGQHNERHAYDQKRTAWLETQGFHVLRFWNNDVFDNLDGVLETILTAIDTPPPRPSPSEEGEGEEAPPQFPSPSSEGEG